MPARRHGIPRRFEVGGHTISVALVPKSRWRHGNCVGVWLPSDLRIEILSSQPATARQHTFCHELVHALCDQMSGVGLKVGRDEGFVDSFAGLLNQALTTFE